MNKTKKEINKRLFKLFYYNIKIIHICQLIEENSLGKESSLNQGQLSGFRTNVGVGGSLVRVEGTRLYEMTDRIDYGGLYSSCL